MIGLSRAAILIALIAAVGTLAWYLTQDTPPPAIDAPDVIAPRAPSPTPVEIPELPTGGVYSGIVVDEEGGPVQGALVMLVAFEAGNRLPAAALQDPENFDPTLVPRIGYRRDAQGKTDAAGRFAIPADARSAIAMVVAWRRGYMPSIAGAGQPGGDLRVVLKAAGQFVGTVLDKESREPISGAKVAVYLQQRAAAPAVGRGSGPNAGGRPDPESRYALSPFAQAQRFVAEILGPLVWESPWQGDSALHFLTDSQGRFRVGHMADEVQLEFIITHPEYEWSDFDNTEGGSGAAVRTVVGPGEVVERTFELIRGKFIEGVVLDEDEKPVRDVVVEVEHVVQDNQHWWYRVKTRSARTARDGTFRVAGLSTGPYKVMLRHPAFGADLISKVPENATGLRWHVQNLGSLAGTVVGLDRTLGARVDIAIEPIVSSAGEGPLPRPRREQVRLDANGRFLLSKLKPGRYGVWVTSDGMASAVEELEISSLAVTDVTFEVGGGGVFEVEILDQDGRVVDPAEVVLSAAEGSRLLKGVHTMGRFVSRQGIVEARGLVPGTYRAVVQAAGFPPKTTEPFEVSEGERTHIGVVTLERQAYLQVTGVETPRDRPITQPVRLFVQPEGEEERAAGISSGLPLPIPAGSVRVRAEAGDLRFETTIEVAPGETVPLALTFR